MNTKEKKMRKVIQEIILESIDDLGLPSTEDALEDSLASEDKYADIIAAGEEALEAIGGAIDEAILVGLKKAHSLATENASLQPFHVFVKAGAMLARDVMPDPDQIIKIIKALIFSLDTSEDKELQKLLLQQMTDRGFRDRIYSYYRGPSSSQDKPSIIDIDDVTSLDGIPVVDDLDDQEDMTAMLGDLDLPDTVREARRLSDMDLLGETTEATDASDDNVSTSTDETNTVNESNSLELDRFAWGQAKEAPQPGVETDGQLTESRGSLIRNRYYGRY